MNARIKHCQTPEERIAAVARALAIDMEMNHARTGAGPTEPDYADYREALSPYIRREILLARIDEVRKSLSLHLTGRVSELAKELAEIEGKIPLEYRL
jgi:hypothetical protein